MDRDFDPTIHSWRTARARSSQASSQAEQRPLRRKSASPYYRTLQALKDQSNLRLERLIALQSMEMAINANLDLPVVLDLFIAQAKAQLGVDAANLFLFPSGETVWGEQDPGLMVLSMRCVAHRGFQSAAPGIYQELAQRVVGERQVVVLTDLSSSLSTDHSLCREGFVSYFGVPLLAQGHLKGVLEFYHRSPLRPDYEWIKFMDALATQAAIAIHNAELIDNLQRSNQDLVDAYDSTIEGWSRALELRDHETAGHAQRVTDLTLRLAVRMSVPEKDLIHIRRGVLLHDIGKMGIPDKILLKPGPLTDEEFALMRHHPGFAYQLLSPIWFLQPALEIPYCHHERWDGSGYPRGLSGEQIPLAARIFAVIDVWDALISDRPYRKAWPMEQVTQYIREQSGKHFDPQVVSVFLEMIEHHLPADYFSSVFSSAA